MGRMSSADLEKQLSVLKNEIRGLIISSPKGVTVNQFLVDYKKQLGKTFPYKDFKFNNPTEFLNSLTDTVKLQKGVLIPVCSSRVVHIDAMVSKQKNSSKYRHLPSRVSAEIINDTKQIRKPVQLPLETKQTTCNSVNRIEETEKPHLSFNLKDHSSEKIKPLFQDDFKMGYSSNYDGHEDESSMFHWRIQKGLGPTSDSIHSDDLKENVQDPYYDNIEYCNGPVVNEMYTSEKEYVHAEENDEDNSFNIGITLKNNLRSLLRDNPDGIPLSKLLTKYGEKFNKPFAFREYGCTSMTEFVHSLPSIFRCEKGRGFGEFILFDKNQPICPDKKSKWIPQLIQANVEKLVCKFKDSFPNGICETDFLHLYEKEFKETIDLKSLHFNSLSTFLNSCTTVDCQQIEDKTYVFPKVSDFSDEIMNDILVLPPMSEMSFLFKQYFTNDECDGSITYKKIDTSSLHPFIRVCISDVLTPNNIWMQLESNVEDLRRLMIELNDYYNHYEDNHILHPAVAIKDLVCAVRFDIDRRWHRCKIMQNTNKSEVQVHYVDYGTVNLVNVQSLRKLSKKFIDLPAQGINVSLDQLTYPPESDGWNSDTIDFIYSSAIEKKFLADVVGLDEVSNILNVLLYNIDDETQTLNDLLINSGYAIHSSMVRINQNVTADVQIFPQSTQKPIESDDTMEASEEDHSKRVRTPPGYPSKVDSFQQQSMSIPCDHFQQLYSEYYELRQRFTQIEQKLKEMESHNIYNCNNQMQDHPDWHRRANNHQNPIEFVQGVPLVPQQYNSFPAPYNPPMAPRPVVNHSLHHTVPGYQNPVHQHGTFNYYPTPHWQHNNIPPQQNMMFNQQLPWQRPPINYHLPQPPPAPRTHIGNIPYPSHVPFNKNVPRPVAPYHNARSGTPNTENKVEKKDTPCLNSEVGFLPPQEAQMSPVPVDTSKEDQISNKWKNYLPPPLECETTSAGPVEPLSVKQLSPKSTEDFSLNENLINSFCKKSYRSSLSSLSVTNEIETPVINENGLKVNENEEEPNKELNNGIINSVIDTIQPQDLTKRIMKIHVTGSVSGGAGVIHILLLKENKSKKLVVLLSQLLKNYSPDTSLETLVKNKQSDLPIYDIFLADHIPVFHQLLKEKLISDEQLTLHVVNFDDVGVILDVICPENYPDLNELKEIFHDLSGVVTVEDQFWYNPQKE